MRNRQILDLLQIRFYILQSISRHTNDKIDTDIFKTGFSRTKNTVYRLTSSMGPVHFFQPLLIKGLYPYTQAIEA